MHYHITAPSPNAHFLDITLTINQVTEPNIEIQMPAWRPGRYEIQNFAKNIQNIDAFCVDGHKLPLQKITKDRWRVSTKGVHEVVLKYTYYAFEQNAGTSYIDATLWYLNFINFAFYVEGRIQEAYTLNLDLPEGYIVACGLKKTAKYFEANDFYHLVDSPLLASKTMQHSAYEVDGVNFHIWMHGNWKPDWKRIESAFKRFSKEQLATMHEFPEQDYHFINLVLPTAFYHGVEHRNSTMVVLGPDEEGEGLYNDLLGVSSHELFHTWNVIRIRPIELLPYDYTQENYFGTCFVAEGCTTYFGDLFLKRAGVFDDEAYFKELQVYMKRHFEFSADASQSLIDSSFDLWLDGYEKGIPNRKVSVYHKGALVAMILDLYLRKQSSHQKSLDDVMRVLWQRFGKPFVGYTLQDYKDIVEEIAGEELPWYWTTCVHTNTPLQELLNEMLSFVGLQMSVETEGNVLLNTLDDLHGSIQRTLWLSSNTIFEEEPGE